MSLELAVAVGVLGIAFLFIFLASKMGEGALRNLFFFFGLLFVIALIWLLVLLSTGEVFHDLLVTVATAIQWVFVLVVGWYVLNLAFDALRDLSRRGT